MTETLIDFRYRCATCGRERVIPNVSREGLQSWCLPKVKIRCPACQVIGAVEAPPPPPPDPHIKEIERWVPAIYRESDESRFPQEQWATCKHWIPGPKGLMLFGPTSRCKSRIAYWLAMKAIRNGSKVQCYDSRTFRAEVEHRIAAGTLWAWYKELELMTDVLLFDDFGKIKGEGKRIEEEMFSLVKLRVEARKGLLLTTNDTPITLGAQFSGGIAGPLISRLMETCNTVDFRTPEERTQRTVEVGTLDL